MVAKVARHFTPCCMVSGATASCAFDHALGAQSVIWPLGGARLANNGVPSGRMMSFSGNASTLPAGRRAWSRLPASSVTWRQDELRGLGE